MKAIAYLQKIGAIPEFNLRDLQLAVVVIASELFEEGMMVEPDCVQWTQQSSHDEESPWDCFSKRCEIIECATNSNLEGLVPLLSKVDNAGALKDLIEELIEIRLFYFSFFAEQDQPDQEADNDEWFVNLYNQLVGLSKGETFTSKSQILRFFYTGALSEVGNIILKNRGVKL